MELIVLFFNTFVIVRYFYNLGAIPLYIVIAIIVFAKTYFKCLTFLHSKYYSTKLLCTLCIILLLAIIHAHSYIYIYIKIIKVFENKYSLSLGTERMSNLVSIFTALPFFSHGFTAVCSLRYQVVKMKAPFQ